MHKGFAKLSKNADGKVVVTGSYDKTARVWDVSIRKPLHVLEGHTGAVLCCAVTADGKAGGDGLAGRNGPRVGCEHRKAAACAGPH